MKCVYVCVTERGPVTSYIFTKYNDIIICFLIEGSEECSLQSSFCKSVVSVHWFIKHVWPFGYSLLSIISKISSGEELKNNLTRLTVNLPYQLLNLVLNTLNNKHSIFFFTIKALYTMYTTSVLFTHTTRAGFVSVGWYLLKILSAS